MEIKGNARRILKYLSERQEKKSFYPTSLYNKNHINVKSRDELNSEIALLCENNLVAMDGENIMLTSTGKMFIEQIEYEENKEIYKDIFSNFKLALLKYFYARNEPLEVDELPSAFEQNVEKHYQPNGSDAYNLMHFIEIENRQYFNIKSHKYELNENGKQYLSHLLTKEEKDRTPIFSTINIHHQTGDNLQIQGDGNTINQNSSFDKSPITSSVDKSSNAAKTNTKKSAWIEKASWIIGIIASLVALYEFVVKKFM